MTLNKKLLNLMNRTLQLTTALSIFSNNRFNQNDFQDELKTIRHIVIANSYKSLMTALLKFDNRHLYKTRFHHCTGDNNIVNKIKYVYNNSLQ